MNPLKVIETGLYAVLTVAFVGAAVYWIVAYLAPSLINRTAGNIPLPVLFAVAISLLLLLGWLSRDRKEK